MVAARRASLSSDNSCSTLCQKNTVEVVEEGGLGGSGSDGTYLNRYDNRRAKRAGDFLNMHVKIPPDNAENVVI